MFDNNVYGAKTIGYYPVKKAELMPFCPYVVEK